MIAIDLSGHLALVTGATGELGRVMVRTLAAAGAAVVVHFHRNHQTARKLADEVHAAGGQATAFGADITDEAAVKRMADDITKELSSPDIVVSSAVIQYEWTTVLAQRISDYESQFRSCVLQNVILAKHFAPAMVERGWGRIIGINTECAMQNWENQSAYVSGKRGMDGVLRVLAREIGGSGVTVNQVAPGWTISENSPDSEAPPEYRDRIPLRRRGTDQEIANVVAFLASDLASYITGAYVPVCGGNVMPAI